MIFAAVPLAAANGALLAHGQTVGALRWVKGRILSADDLAVAAAAGLTRLTVARLDPGDVPEAAAAQMLGAALSGANVTARPPAHGRVNLAAAAAGLLLFESAAVDALNAVDEALTLGTLPPHTRVAAGDLIATIKVIPYAVPGATLARATQVAMPFCVAPFRATAVELIHTRLPGTTDKAIAKAESVTRARLEALGATVVGSRNCAHDVAALTALLAATSDAAIVLVAGASATVDRGDVIPAAIVAAGGAVDRLGMPVDPGHLLCLGRVAGRVVIGLPGCARSPRRNGFDWVLERLVAGLPVTGQDIASMGVGGLLPETPRPLPRERQ